MTPAILSSWTWFRIYYYFLPLSCWIYFSICYYGFWTKFGNWI